MGIFACSLDCSEVFSNAVVKTIQNSQLCKRKDILLGNKLTFLIVKDTM